MTTETYEILGRQVCRVRQTAVAPRASSRRPTTTTRPHPIDYFVWVIRNAKRTILVDCGFDEAEGRQARPQRRARAGSRARTDRHPGRAASTS